ncbi:MAG: hypothetical protein K2L03_02270 [Bacteroidales bacterium]|nr:hypothetical protein [Bacteroidales bacterium]
MLDTPILFIVFNRIDTAQKVFERIRQARPKKLYIACDGPRNGYIYDNINICKTRDLTKQVDWPCEVFTNFLDHNEGPRNAVFRFIKWFFEHEEQGIILEHDCLPHPDFFVYCETLLNRYKDDPRIGTISGNSIFSHPKQSNSYIYSIYSLMWGWATWRRVIDQYTLDVNAINRKEFQTTARQFALTPIEKHHAYFIFKRAKRGKIKTWDYSLGFCLWKNRMLSISPDRNLVTNIGFDRYAANTTNLKSPSANRPVYPILPLQFNDNIVPDRQDDYKYFRTFIVENEPAAYVYFKILLKKIGLFALLQKIKKRFLKS